MRRRWTQEEQTQAIKCFGSNIEAEELSSLGEITRVQRELKYLQDRTPAMIKTWIYNQLRNKKNGREIVAPKIIDKTITRHIAFIFEECIADRKMPTMKQCAEVQKNDKRFKTLSAQEIRQIVSTKINEK